MFCRTHRYWELFLNVHQLWSVCFVMLLLHGPVFWIWALPWCLFMAAERYIGAYKAKERVIIDRVLQHPGNVMEIRMKLPHGKQLAGGRWQAGQYIQMQCPEINVEWHPFTISSAPEDRKYFSVHIRCRKGMDWCVCACVCIVLHTVPALRALDQARAERPRTERTNPKA